MQQIKSTGFRAGITQNWLVGQKNQNIYNSNNFQWWLRIVIKDFLSKKNSYLVTFNISTISTDVVFYKYLQRSRLSYLSRTLHLLKTGKYYKKNSELSLFKSQFYTINTQKVLKFKFYLRKLFALGLGRITFLNIFSIIGPISPKNFIYLVNFYKFKKHSKLLYYNDSVQILYVTSLTYSTCLLADLIAKGLARNRRAHSKFLFMLRDLLNYMPRFSNKVFFSLKNVRFAIYGKVNGQMRRKIISVNHPTNNFNSQTLLLKTNYTFRCVVTKYGIFGIKVWLQFPSKSEDLRINNLNFLNKSQKLFAELRSRDANLFVRKRLA
jgi:hypothetical protein